MHFISVHHYFTHSWNYYLSTYIHTSVWIQTLQAFLSLLPLPQSLWENKVWVGFWYELEDTHHIHSVPWFLFSTLKWNGTAMFLKNEILTTSWGMQLRKSSLLSSEGLRDATPGGKPNIHQKKYPKWSANAEARSSFHMSRQRWPKSRRLRGKRLQLKWSNSNSLQAKSLVFTGSNSGKLHNLH